MFFTKYNPAPSIGFSTVGDSLTQQQFKDESDINWIIAHYQDPARPSLVSPTAPRVPLFGDFSQVPDFATAHQIFQMAESEFYAQPAEIRAKFDNNPVKMMMFLDSATPDDIRGVFGVAPDKSASSVVTPASSVSSVNVETVDEQAKPE